MYSQIGIDNIKSSINLLAEVLTDEDPEYQNEVKGIDSSIQKLFEKKVEIRSKYTKKKIAEIAEILKTDLA